MSRAKIPGNYFQHQCSKNSRILGTWKGEPNPNLGSKLPRILFHLLCRVFFCVKETVPAFSISSVLRSWESLGQSMLPSPVQLIKISLSTPLESGCFKTAFSLHKCLACAILPGPITYGREKLMRNLVNVQNGQVKPKRHSSREGHFYKIRWNLVMPMKKQRYLLPEKPASKVFHRMLLEMLQAPNPISPDNLMRTTLNTR